MKAAIEAAAAAKPQMVAAPVPPMAAETFEELAPAPEASDNAELARARAIAQRLGITNLTDDEYDIPTYMRRQDREL
jgi:hypothetical protein